MRRGYTRESYLELIDRAREIIPNVAISSDMISGFCGETEEEHRDTITLMEKVQYDQAFMFAYSLRDKTHAARNYVDDVPEDVKLSRLQEVISTFRNGVQKKNEKEELGQIRLVLVEGQSSKASLKNDHLTGRTDTNKRTLFKFDPVPDKVGFESKDPNAKLETPKKGDYIAVEITEIKGSNLRAKPLYKTSISEFSDKK